MLTKEISTKITEFIRQKPRTVQEIAFLIKKNWRTADRYVNELATETGLIGVRTFREGSRGALKVVFWNALEPARGSAYQEKLLQEILTSKKKEDFSLMDIYQFVDCKKRKAFFELKEIPKNNDVKFNKVLSFAKKQVLFLSGNLSWIKLEPNRYALLENLAKNKISIKILAKIDTTSVAMSEKLLSINQRVGWDAIEIRHCRQPIRGMIIDDSVVSLKEVLNPNDYRKKELAKKSFIFYLIKDLEWIYWLQKVFWYLWTRSISAVDRINTIASIN